MNWMSISGGLVTAVSLGLFTLAMGHRREMTAERYPERRIIKYNDSAKAFVVIFGGLSPFAVLFLYVSGQLNMDAALSLLAIIAATVAYFGPEFFKTRIEFDLKNVYTYSVWRKPRVIPWSVIMACKYSPFRRWREFDTFGYGTVRISDWMDGTEEFIAHFKKLGQECLDFTRAQAVGASPQAMGSRL